MKKSILILLFFIIFVPTVFARSGCCSHHLGVCGCGCCDGSPLSSICAPYYPECNGEGAQINQTSYTIPTQAPYIPPTVVIYPTEIPTLVPDSTYEPTIEVTPELADSSSKLDDMGSILSIPILAGVGYLVYRVRKK